MTFMKYFVLYNFTHQPYLRGPLGIKHENVGKSTT